MPRRKQPSPDKKTLDDSMFNTIASQSPIGIIVIQDGDVLFANNELAKLIGYPLKELHAMKADDFLNFVADADKIKASRYLKSVTTGEVKTKFYELHVKDRKGEFRWLQVLPRMITVHKKPAILAMVFETTQQKRLEQAYRDLVDHSLQGLLIIQDMKVVFSNRAFAEISGYTVDELLNLSANEIENRIHPDYRARVWKRMRDRLEGKDVPSHYEFKAFRKDGEERWLEMYVTAIEYNGKPAIQATFIDITQRRETDIRLQESETQYRGLFDEMPLGLYRTSVEGQIIDANPALVKLLGAKDKESLLQLSASDFYVNREERKQFQDFLAQESVVTGHDAQFKRLDGKIIWVHDTFRAIRDNKSSIQYYEGSLEDITERKVAEQALREREKRYRALFERTSDAVFIISLDLKHLEVNQRAADLMGYTIDELIGMPVDKVVAEGEYEDSKRVLRLLLAGDPVPIYERRLVKKNGNEFPVEINAALVTDVDGNPLHIQSVARDITERKRAELALKESEEKYRTLVETSPDAITLTDLEGKIIMVNQQALQLYGVENEMELVGKDALTLIDPEDVPMAMENLQKTLQEGSSGTIEYTLLRHDGTSYPAELNAALLKDADGNPTAFIGVIRDISERKEAEVKYRSLFDSVPVGLFRTTPDGTILDANPALVEMLGFEKKEDLFEKKASSFYIDPKARKQWEAAVAREDIVTGFQAQFQRSDGQNIWIELSARALRNMEGDIELYEGTLEDISERKRSEDIVRESEAKYRALVNQSLQGLAILQENRVVFANPRLKDIIGISPEELLKMPQDSFWNLIHPEDREWVQQRLQDRFAGKSVPDRYELRIQAPDGRPLWIEIWAKIIEYQGNPALQVAFMDVTERKRADQAIKESEGKYRTLVEQSLFGLVISRSPPLRIFFANEAFAQMVGYSVEEILAMSPKKAQDLIHPMDQQLVTERAGKRLAGGHAPEK
ncbi:MAG: PAS domain S-box protein, partial [Candidatus Thorarchaeota archaeon]